MKKLKILAFFSLFIAAALTLSACSNQESSENNNKTSSYEITNLVGTPSDYSDANSGNH